jgi:hypothetical protein
VRIDSARSIAAGAAISLARDHPCPDILMPLSDLLARGGDARLWVDPRTRLNGYGCRPFPRPEAFTFASSTATSISHRAYARARQAQFDLVHATLNCGVEEAVDQRMEEMRRELRAHLRLGANVDIVFSPSGTDSQLHAFCIARSIFAASCTSIVVAADETGSGTVFVSEGRHFGESTAQGVAVNKGAFVAGLAETPPRVSIPLRDARGDLRDEGSIDREVVESVAAVIKLGGRVMLHAMDYSKLGSRGPSLSCLQELSTRWPESVIVVVDACQMRLSRARLSAYLNSGFLVAITGSKFFTGPPFSGALLVPDRLSGFMQNREIAAGLGDYANRCDWPHRWRKIRAQLPNRVNLGQWLRWEAALEEMRRYFLVPEQFRRMAFWQFSVFVRTRLARSPCLDFFPVQTRPESADDDELSTATIFPFTVRSGETLLPHGQSAILYRLVNEDASHLLPATATPRQRAVAAQPCHIGQPVPLRGLGGSAAHRVSAGARVVSDTWSGDEEASIANLQREFHQVDTIFEKIELLVQST